MDDFSRLYEKLEAYKKLGDAVNRRQIVETMISEYPGQPESWYEKAKLLSGDFSGNLVVSDEYMRCMSNIQKLAGVENAYYQECYEFAKRVEALKEVQNAERKKKEQEDRARQWELDRIKRNQDKARAKRIAIILSVTIAFIGIVTYFSFPAATRKTYSSEEEMKADIKPWYIHENGFYRNNVWHGTSKTKIVISDDTFYKIYDIDGEAYTLDVPIDEYNYKRGYISTGLGKVIITKSGRLEQDGEEYAYLGMGDARD